MIILFIQLIVAHIFADFVFQTDYIAKEKQNSMYMLIIHGIIHGYCIYFLTEIPWMSLIEIFNHVYVDKCKIDGRLSFIADQSLHYTHKVVYMMLYVMIIIM